MGFILATASSQQWQQRLPVGTEHHDSYGKHRRPPFTHVETESQGNEVRLPLVPRPVRMSVYLSSKITHSTAPPSPGILWSHQPKRSLLIGSGEGRTLEMPCARGDRQTLISSPTTNDFTNEETEAQRDSVVNKAPVKKVQSPNLNPCFLCRPPCGSNLEWVAASLENSFRFRNKSGTRGGTSSRVKTPPPTNTEAAYFLKSVGLLSRGHSLRDPANNWHVKSNPRQRGGENWGPGNKASLGRGAGRMGFCEIQEPHVGSLDSPLTSHALDLSETRCPRLQKWGDHVHLAEASNDVLSSEAPHTVLVPRKVLGDGGCRSGRSGCHKRSPRSPDSKELRSPWAGRRPQSAGCRRGG